MARLTRKNIKVFAENATNNGVFGSLQANNPTQTNDVDRIQSLDAWGEGWNSATQTAEKLPPLEEFQGVQYVLSYQQAYLMQEGIAEWSADTTYYKGGIAKEITSTGFILYCSKTDDNKGYLLNNTNYWSVVFNSDDPYAFDSDVVHITRNETVDGTKTFSASPVISTATANTVPVFNGTKALTSSAVTSTELGYLDGVTSNIQTQLNNKQASGSYVTTNTAQTISAVKTFSAIPKISATIGASDNSTQVPTTSWVNSRIINIMDSIYPVGSLYFCTQSTCPLSAIISGSTWENIGTKLLTDVSTKIKSNGSKPTFVSTAGTTAYLCTHKDGYYRANTLWLSNSSGEQFTGADGLVQKFGSQTGLEATNTQSSLTVNIFKRTA